MSKKDSLPRIGFALMGGPINHWSLLTLIQSILESLNGKAELVALSGGLEPLLKGSRQGVFDLHLSMFQETENMRACPLVTERNLPRRDPLQWGRAVDILSRDLKLSALIASGGDGSFITLNQIRNHNKNRLERIVLIPRTMDADFLMPSIDLGFASARHHATESMLGYAGDASLYGAPCVTQVMGRDTGIFAQYCAGDIGARMSLVPEEFALGSLQYQDLVDALILHILMALKEKEYTQILVAEGFWRALTLDAQDTLGIIRLGPEQHNRIDYKNSPPIGERLAVALTQRAAELGIEGARGPLDLNFRQVGYSERQRRQVEVDEVLARTQGKRAAELALSSDRSIPQGVIALPKGYKRFSEVQLEDGGNRVKGDEVSLTGEPHAQALKHQLWCSPAKLKDDKRVDGLRQFCKMSRRDFRRTFRRGAELFNHRDSLGF